MSILELYDYWYDVNIQLAREEKLRGRLRVTAKMLELQPGNIRNVDKKGDHLMGLKRYEEALNTCKKAFDMEGNVTEYRPEHYIRFLKMAKCQWELGQYSEVLESCGKIPASYQYTPNKPYIEAKAPIKLNRPKEALEQLKIFLLRKKSSIKSAMATDPAFEPLWSHEEFMELIARAY